MNFKSRIASLASLCGSPGPSCNVVGTFPVIKFNVNPPAVHGNQIVIGVDFPPPSFRSDRATGLDWNALGCESLPSAPLSILYREVTSC